MKAYYALLDVSFSKILFPFLVFISGFLTEIIQWASHPATSTLSDHCSISRDWQMWKLLRDGGHSWQWMNEFLFIDSNPIDTRDQEHTCEPSLAFFGFKQQQTSKISLQDPAPVPGSDSFFKWPTSGGGEPSYTYCNHPQQNLGFSYYKTGA